jgi:benzoylsuccinyl-CoA thiolase BbsA subunit
MAGRKLITDAGRALFINEDDWSRSTLKGSRCQRCGSVDFPRALYCKGCLSSDLKEIQLSRDGVLYSFSYARVCAKGFTPPYVFGYVDLPDGIRIYSQLEPADPAKFRSGMDVELTMGQIRQEKDGTEIWGYKFQPKEKS